MALLRKVVPLTAGFGGGIMVSYRCPKRGSQRGVMVAIEPKRAKLACGAMTCPRSARGTTAAAPRELLVVRRYLRTMLGGAVWLLVLPSM